MTLILTGGVGDRGYIAIGHQLVLTLHVELATIGLGQLHAPVAELAPRLRRRVRVESRKRDEIPPVECRFVRLTMLDWPKSSPLSILDMTVFGRPTSYFPNTNPIAPVLDMSNRD